MPYIDPKGYARFDIESKVEADVLAGDMLRRAQGATRLRREAAARAAIATFGNPDADGRQRGKPAEHERSRTTLKPTGPGAPVPEPTTEEEYQERRDQDRANRTAHMIGGRQCGKTAAAIDPKLYPKNDAEHDELLAGMMPWAGQYVRKYDVTPLRDGRLLCRAWDRQEAFVVGDEGGGGHRRFTAVDSEGFVAFETLDVNRDIVGRPDPPLTDIRKAGKRERFVAADPAAGPDGVMVECSWDEGGRVTVRRVPKPRSRVTVRPFFRWFDLWIGAYIDTENKRLYICPLPMVGVCIEWGARP